MFRAPITSVEQTVAEIFADVLGVERVGLDDDFFELGGNSLIATQVAARLGTALDTEVAVRDLFEAPTVAALAARVETHAGQGGRVPLTRVPRPALVPLSPGAAAHVVPEPVRHRTAVNNIPVAIRLTGELDEQALGAAVADVLARHEMLRTMYPAVDGVGYQQVLPVSQVVLDLDPEPVAAAELATRVEQLAGCSSTSRSRFRSGPRCCDWTAKTMSWCWSCTTSAADGFSMGPLLRDIVVGLRRAGARRIAGVVAAAGAVRRLRAVAARGARRRGRSGIADRAPDRLLA